MDRMADAPTASTPVMNKQPRAHPAAFLAAILVLIVGAVTGIAYGYYLWGTLIIIPPLLYLSVFHPKTLFYLAALTAPFTIEYRLPGISIALAFPTEPLLILLAGFFLLHLLYVKHYPPEILRHPLTLLIMAYLGWMLITALTGTMLTVSVKYWIKHFVYVTVLYFYGIVLYRQWKPLKNFVILYSVGLTLVSLYTLRVESRSFFSHEVAYFASAPFYNDHTIYGAILGLMLPLMLGFGLWPRRFGLSRWEWLLMAGASIVNVISLVLSYARAAWLSIAGVVAFIPFLAVRMRLRWILSLVAVAAALIMINWESIYVFMATNRASSTGDFRRHIQSIYNIATDPSNMERINRWSCALRMARDRPLFGFGPGTFPFQYGPYQLSYQRTIISTDFGDVGGAHHEYLAALAETGIPGMILFVALVLTSISIGMRAFYDRQRPRHLRWAAACILIGLITYYIHGFINNFLDTDELPFVFWALLGMLVAVDLEGRKQRQKNPA